MPRLAPEYVSYKSIQLIRYLHPWLALKMHKTGTCLVVQWLRLHAPNARDLGSIPGQGTRSCMLQLSSHVATKDTACGNLKDPVCSD